MGAIPPASEYYLITKAVIDNFLLTVLAVGAPFLHLLAAPGQEGILGWKWMSSFLNALGWPISILAISVLMLRDASRVPQELHKPLKNRAYIIMGLGCYYLLYVCVGTFGVDYPIYIYYLAMLVFTIALVIVVTQINRVLLSIENQLKSVIRSLMDRILVGFYEKKLVDPSKIEQYEEFCEDTINETVEAI